MNASYILLKIETFTLKDFQLFNWLLESNHLFLFKKKLNTDAYCYNGKKKKNNENFLASKPL